MIQVLDGLLTTNEAARLVGRSVPTINRWVKAEHLAPAGKLPGKTGTYLFRPEDVKAAARLVESATT